MHDECKKSSADANVREINPSDRTNRSVAARTDTSSSTIAIMRTPGTCPILDANNQWEQHRRRTAQLKCASKPRRWRQDRLAGCARTGENSENSKNSKANSR